MNDTLKRILENQRVILSALLDEDKDCCSSEEVMVGRRIFRMKNLEEAINETEILLNKNID